jgi:hypothetical protein
MWDSSLKNKNAMALYAGLSYPMRGQMLGMS